MSHPNWEPSWSEISSTDSDPNQLKDMLKYKLGAMLVKYSTTYNGFYHIVYEKYLKVVDGKEEYCYYKSCHAFYDHTPTYQESAGYNIALPTSIVKITPEQFDCETRE